jgi:hypothetical protein
MKKWNISQTYIILKCLDKVLPTFEVDDEELKELNELNEQENDFYLTTAKIKMQLKKSSLIMNARKLLNELKQKGVSIDDRNEMKRLLTDRIKKMCGTESPEYQDWINIQRENRF